MKPTFARRFIAGVLGLVSVVAFTSSAQAAGEVKHPRAVNGSWEGPFGRFDRAQLQRGFQVSYLITEKSGVSILYNSKEKIIFYL